MRRIIPGRGFVDYSENREHTHRYTHKGSYRVRPRLKNSYEYKNKSNCPSFCLSDNVNHPYDHQFHRHINDLEFVEPKTSFSDSEHMLLPRFSYGKPTELV